MKTDDINDMGDKLLIMLPNTKTKRSRSFVVTEYLSVYRKYAASRPSNLNNRRVFYKYANGKAHHQFIGIHKFGKMPEEIATFLGLSHAKEYTGHCFRRTSATLLVHSGGDITMLKQHGGWKSCAVAEGYIEDSLANKSNIGNKIFSGVSGVSSVDTKVVNFTGKEGSGQSSIVLNNCSQFTINISNK